MHSTKQLRKSQIQALASSLQQRLVRLQSSNRTLSHLSQETQDFLSLVQELRATKTQRKLLIRRIEEALAQTCGELLACEQEQTTCDLRGRLKLLQSAVKRQCVQTVKSEQISEGEEPLVSAPSALSFLSPPSPH